MMSFIQQFYQDCLVKFALMGICPMQGRRWTMRGYGSLCCR